MRANRCAISNSTLAIGALITWVPTTLLAQRTTGVPGSPEANAEGMIVTQGALTDELETSG